MFLGLSFGQRKKKWGYVAEYCPRCASIQVCRLTEIIRYTNILWVIPVSTDVIATLAICPECNFRISTRIPRESSVIQDIRNDVDECIRRTNPLLPLIVQQKFEREAAIADGEGDPHERLEVMVSLLQHVEAHVFFADLKRRADLMVISAVAAMLGAVWFVVAAANNRYQHPDIEIYALGTLILTFVLILAAIQTEPRRRVRRWLRPYVGDQFSYVRATRAEVSAVLLGLKRGSYMVGRLRVGWIMRAMAHAQSRQLRDRNAL